MHRIITTVKQLLWHDIATRLHNPGIETTLHNPGTESTLHNPGIEEEPEPA